MRVRVRTGLERLVADEAARVAGRAVGLLAHPASVTHRLGHARAVLTAVGAWVPALSGPGPGVGGGGRATGGSLHGRGPLQQLFSH